MERLGPLHIRADGPCQGFRLFRACQAGAKVPLRILHLADLAPGVGLGPLIPHCGRLGQQYLEGRHGFGMAGPARLEWWGDDVSSIRGFDLTSQRSTDEMTGVTVLPLFDGPAICVTTMGVPMWPSDSSGFLLSRL